MLSVQLQDLSFHAFHGIYEGEAKVGNNYRVHLTVKYDESNVKLDNLASIINYEELYDIVKKRMAIATPLLEEVAEAIVRKIRHQYSVSKEVIISIYKIQPPIEYFQGNVGITLEKNLTINRNILNLIISIFLALPLGSICQDVVVLLEEAELLQESRKENEAFKKYQQVLKLKPGHLTALCKASELSSLIGNRQSTKALKLEHFNAARRYAESALRVNPNYAEANFVMAMALGRMALLLSGREKVTAVVDIKKYAENAVRNDPRNFKAYHVLGKWHYEVSSLSAFERLAAKLLFGGLPISSYAESVKFYEKSRSLKPDFAINYLEIAKAYHKNHQDSQAIAILKQLQSIPVKEADDPRIKKEGNEFLKQLQD